MSFFRNLKNKLSHVDISYLRFITISAMLLLLFAQLVWWVIFFEMNYTSRDLLEAELDGIKLAVKNKKNFQVESNGLFVFRDGLYQINPERIKERRKEHRRNLIMLISETVFLLVVILYGSFRVWRSIREENRLVQDRHIFMDSVSHELKTPLASLKLILQTLQKRSLKPELQAEMLQEGVVNIDRLNEQVNNLLTAGAILRNKNSQDLEQAREIIDLKDEVAAYLSSNDSLLRQAKAQITTSLTSLKVHMNREMFQKICSNLVQNSIQYSPDEPLIEISLSAGSVQHRREEKIAILIFQDRGAGIPPRQLQKVFQPLYRIPGDNRPVRGSGMGLYLVSQIINSAGGSVRARIPEDGQGTIIEIRIPLAGEVV